MDRQFYDFIFNLRASQFRHHTPEFEQELHYKLLSPFHQNLDCTAFSPHGFEGVISESRQREYRNFMIGCTFIYCRLALQEHADSEQAYYINDYYLAKAETIFNENDLMVLLEQMIMSYRNLILLASTPSYGYPIDKCINYITQNLYSSLTLKQVADYMKMSPSYLTTLFREHVGESAYQYIQRRKYKEAQMLLTHTSKSLTEISDALGYNSLAHFSRIFKTYSGMAPGRYRKEHSNAGLFEREEDFHTS